MNENMNMPGLTAEQRPYELYGSRSFQNIGGDISGRSVVIQKEQDYPEREMASDMWPYSMSDYLKGFIGRMVLIEYVFNNAGCRKKGILKVAGINFIGIQTLQNGSLLLLDLSTIKSINILD